MTMVREKTRPARLRRSEVTIRELVPEDLEPYLEGFARLSRRSILHRFNDPIRGLTPFQARYLTQVDRVTHYACCAHVDLDGRQHGVGVGRYHRLPGAPGVAEFALTVIDDYQGRGLGAMLLEHLVRRARESGILTLRGFVRRDNATMLALVRRRAHTARDAGSPLLQLDLPLDPRGSPPAGPR